MTNDPLEIKWVSNILRVSRSLDKDGELEVEIEAGLSGDCYSVYLDREDALRIIRTFIEAFNHDK